MLPRPINPAFTIAMTLVLASCAVVDKPIPLPEGRWELMTSSFVDAGRIPGLARATLQIRDGRLAAFSGCNTGSAAVSSVDGKMAVSPMATTRRACPEPFGAFEGRYFKLLNDRPYFRIEDDVLILAASEDSARFRRIADQPVAGKPATAKPQP